MLSKQELNLICRKLMLPKASGSLEDYETFKRYIGSKYKLTGAAYNSAISFIENYLKI